MIKPGQWDAFEAVIASGDYLILDTETTGVRAPFEIVQIAIIEAATGQIALNQLVKPVRPISSIATAIHGIDNETVAKAPTWVEARWFILKKLRGRHVVTYNAKYDRWAMHESDRAAGLAETNYNQGSVWHCAMLYYADFNGDWDDYHGKNRWVTLSQACRAHKIEVRDAHQALADCQATAALLRAVWKVRQREIAAAAADSQAPEHG